MNIMKQQGLVWLALLVLAGGCTPTSNTIDHGPFEVNIQSLDGLPVEDVIVTLSQFIPGPLEKSRQIYYQQVVGNSGQTMVFARGEVDAKPGQSVTMSIVTSHPYYQFVNHNGGYVQFDYQPQGIVVLPQQSIRSGEEVMAKSRQILTADLVKKGKSEQQIAQALKAYQTVSLSGIHYAVNHYFTAALALNRTDLIDKYLPKMIEQLVANDKTQSLDAKQLERQFRQQLEKIKEKMQ